MKSGWGQIHPGLRMGSCQLGRRGFPFGNAARRRPNPDLAHTAKRIMNPGDESGFFFFFFFFPAEYKAGEMALPPGL